MEDWLMLNSGCLNPQSRDPRENEALVKSTEQTNDCLQVRARTQDATGKGIWERESEGKSNDTSANGGACLRQD